MDKDYCYQMWVAETHRDSWLQLLGMLIGNPILTEI